MRKALAQNPNLLRTLVGLSVTLIFMLSYAVYGATVSPSVYIYKTEATVDTYDASEADQDVQRFYNDEANTTTWTWTVNANDANLTWVNVTATELVRRCGFASDQQRQALQPRIAREHLRPAKPARGRILLR